MVVSRIGVVALLMTGWLVWSCGGGNRESSAGSSSSSSSSSSVKAVATKGSGVASGEEESVSPFGVGPIQEPLDLPATIDADLAQKGKEIYENMCTSCHRLDEKYVGPALKGVTKRRKPEWIMNMILAPERMIQEDPIAKQLVIEHNGAVMANQGLTVEEARAVLEYLRQIDSQS